MIFLSVSRDFEAIISAFFWGNVLSVILANALVLHVGFNGHLLGYTAGQIVLLCFLMYRVFYKFNSTVTCSFEFLSSVKKYFDLFLIGIFYYVAIWIDKILYWYSPIGERNKSLFFSQYWYDSCMLLAFMTIVPALAHFMTDLGDSFYDAYKDFYGSIINKAPFREIAKQKKAITKVLKEVSFRVIMLQMVMTGALVFYAPGIVDFLGLGKKCIAIIWAAGFGSFFHVFVLMSLILILYFDRRKAALLLAFFFLATNTIFTLTVIYFFPNLIGIGYAASAFLSAILGVFLLIANVKNIEYLTFVKQPFVKPRLAKPSAEQPGLLGAKLRDESRQVLDIE
jgi:uncharacterized membrane protein